MDKHRPTSDDKDRQTDMHQINTHQTRKDSQGCYPYWSRSSREPRIEKIAYILIILQHVAIFINEMPTILLSALKSSKTQLHAIACSDQGKGFTIYKRPCHLETTLKLTGVLSIFWCLKLLDC